MLPDAKLATPVVPAQLSVGAKKMATSYWAAGALLTKAAGTVSTGFSVSFTVTVCRSVAVLPAAPFTVQVMVVAPLGKTVGASLVTDATA